MATIYKTSRSKFYFARFSDGSGSCKRISKSTKTESKREAKVIAGRFEADARREVAKTKSDSEIPAMIGRTVELASLELQQDRLTLQRAEELIRLMHAAASPQDTGTSFRRFARAWLDLKEKSTAPMTWWGYNRAVKVTCSVLGPKAEGAMRHLTICDLEQVQAALSEGRRGKTANLYFGEIRRILESAVAKEIITRNPASFVKALSTADSKKRVEFTIDEVRRIIAAAPDTEWRELIKLAALTGLRQGDLLSLTGDNIVSGRIQRLPSKTSNSSSEVLVIPLRPETLEWLEGIAGYLFPTIRALKQPRRDKPFKEIMRAAGVADKVVLAAGDPPAVGVRSFHSLRHCAGTWLAEAGVPEDVRMKILGHKSGKVHGGYVHHDEALVRAVASLPKL